MYKKTHILILTLISIFLCHPIYSKETLNVNAADNKIEDQQIPNVSFNNNLKHKPKKKSSTDEANIYLNFENASLENVVNYIAEQKKINIIPHKGLAGITTSLSTRKPLTFQRSWNIMLTLLEMNGFSIINVNDVYRIVPTQEHGKEPLPFYSSGKGIEPNDLPDNDTIIRYIYFFKNIKANNAATILNSMLAPNSIQINKDLEACILTEKSYNIKSAMKIVKELDVGGSKDSIRLVPLKLADADTVARLFEEIIGRDSQKSSIRFLSKENKVETSFFSPITKIVPMRDKNALILLGKDEHLNKIIEFIYKYLDVAIGTAESRLHIKEIQYANAEKLKPIIENIIRPPKGISADKQVVGEYKFFEDVIIAAESPGSDEVRGGGNRLIIACNKEDWKRLDKFISKLDKPQPQIALEVMIVDVGISNDRFLGAELQTKLNKELGKEIGKGAWIQTFNLTAEENLNEYLNTDGNTAGDPSFLTVRTNNSEEVGKDIWGIVKAKLNLDNSNIISQPFLVVNNYQRCSLSDVITRRIKGKLAAKSTDDSPPVEYENLDARNNTIITPYINKSGTVDLKIEIIVEDFESLEEDQPNTITRSLVTRTTMALGEVLVLGGLTKSSLSEEGRKTPILGDIPLIGNLFKRKSRSRTEKNLYIFIRPSIIKPQVDGGPDEYTQLKLDYAKYQILNVDTYYKEKDPIQRWFFKPTNQKIKHKLVDAASGVFRPIDNFTYGKSQPKSVNISEDPYYRATEEVEKMRELRKKRSNLKKRQNRIEIPKNLKALKKRKSLT